MSTASEVTAGVPRTTSLRLTTILWIHIVIHSTVGVVALVVNPSWTVGRAALFAAVTVVMTALLTVLGTSRAARLRKSPSAGPIDTPLLVFDTPSAYVSTLWTATFSALYGILLLPPNDAAPIVAGVALGIALGSAATFLMVSRFERDRGSSAYARARNGRLNSQGDWLLPNSDRADSVP